MLTRYFALILLIISAVLMLIAKNFISPFNYDPVGPRAYPLLLLILLSGCSLWLLFKPKISLPAIPKMLIIRAIICVIILLSYAFLFQPAGFILSSLLAIFSLGILFGGAPIYCALTGIIMSISLFILFDSILDVPLPLGILTFIFGS
ncbi:membrane protein [Gammaproteobacteria bacterium]|nr:membrane protein [Gammaproteobacteria bacterium]